MEEKLTNLSQFLTEDHKRVGTLLIELISLNKRDMFTLIPPVLKKLRWHFERHFYVEEKALSIYCELIEIFNEEFRQNLTRQHDSIMEKLTELENNANTQKKSDIESYKEKIEDHVVFETKFFYEELDKNLNFTQKESLINTLQQDVLKGYFPLKQIRKYAEEKAQEFQKKACNINPESNKS
jgi:hypothetical protein